MKNNSAINKFISSLKTQLEERLSALNEVERLFALEPKTNQTAKQSTSKNPTKTRKNTNKKEAPKHRAIITDNKILKKAKDWEHFSVGELLKEFEGLSRPDARGILMRLQKDGAIVQVEAGKGRRAAVYQYNQTYTPDKGTQIEPRA